MKRYSDYPRRMLALLIACVFVCGSVPASVPAAGFTDGETADDSTDRETGLPAEGQEPEDLEDPFAGGQEAGDFAEEFEAEAGDGFDDGSREDGFSAEGDESAAGPGAGEGLSEEKPEDMYGIPLTEEEREKQLEPFRYLTPLASAPKIQSDLDIGTFALFPAKYDARDSGYVTSVKDQASSNLCWGFCQAAIVETSLLMGGMGAYDLSEEHLAYFFANRANDPLGNTPYDKNIHTAADYRDSGNGLLTSIFLSTWSGMDMEEDVPFSADNFNPPDSNKAYNTAAYLKNAVFSDYSVGRMKTLLQQYNAVSVMLYFQPPYYNPNRDAWAYSCNDAGRGVTHMVTIVGWDDTFSHKKFPSKSGVTKDGAWIAKNSWGSGWGDEGYFYISYEDATLSSLVTASAASGVIYPNNYFYDGSSALSTGTMNSGIAYANVYSVKAGGKNAEALGEVVTTTMSDNSHFEIQIYTNLKDVSDPTSGTPAYSQPYAYTQNLAGVCTIPVPEVILLPGQRYSVVIKNAGSKSIEFGVEAADNYGWVRFQVGTDSGQGFLGSDGQWWDMGETLQSTPRIKAHTRTLEEQISMTLAKPAMTLNAGGLENVGAVITPAGYNEKGFTYKSSSTSVAVVDADGNVKGVAPGEAVITCKSRAVDLSASCKVTVKPVTPASVKVSAAYNRIELSWKALPAHTSYVIYRRDGSSAEKKLATVSGGTARYKDTKVVTGTKYTYRLRAYLKTSASGLYSGYSSAVAAVPALKEPKAAVKTTGYAANIITWNKVPGAEGYFLYRRVPGGKWSRLAVVKNGAAVSYMDSRAAELSAYQYMVKAYRAVNKRNVYSTYTPTDTIRTAPAWQKINSVANVSSGLRIRWTAQKKCDGYRIYRKKGNGGWELIKQIRTGTASSYVDKKTKRGATYTYRVQAYVIQTWGNTYSKYTTYTMRRK